MAEYIEREALIDEIEGTTWYHISCQKNLVEGAACEADALYKATDIYNVIKSAPTADVVEVVRCRDCVHSEELDRHCDINRTAYRHCGLWRGDETRNVWHKYNKYYRDYSIVDLDGFCSYGKRKEVANNA